MFLVKLKERRDFPCVQHIESHSNTDSTGCLEHSHHEEEEGTPMARTPTANSIRTMSYRRLGKHKGKVKQNVTVSH